MKNYKITYKPQAEDELYEIFIHIAQDNPGTGIIFPTRNNRRYFEVIRFPVFRAAIGKQKI